MKIKGKDYTDLLAMLQETPMISKLDAYLENGLTEKRHRWDCFWSSDNRKRKEWADRVYQYADDTHIDTALRHAVYYLYVNEEKV